MKTNFTMTKRFLFAIAALAFVASSCSDDDPIVAPDISGIYNLTGAVLVDGNLPDADDTNLTIQNGAIDENQMPVPAVIPAGAAGATGTFFFVNAVLSGLAPCVDPATPVTYQINIKNDGTLAFICTSEGGTSEDNGTWEMSADFKTVTLTILSSTLGQVIVAIESAVFVTGDNGSIAGSIGQYPMIVDAAAAIGATNIQFIAVDVVLTK